MSDTDHIISLRGDVPAGGLAFVTRTPSTTPEPTPERIWVHLNDAHGAAVDPPAAPDRPAVHVLARSHRPQRDPLRFDPSTGRLID